MSVNIVSPPFRERGRDKMYNMWHRVNDGAELILVLEGTGSIVFKSGVYPLVSGGLYYIARGALHYTLPDDPTCYDRIKMLVGASVIEADKELFEFLEEKEAVFSKLSDDALEKARMLFDTISSRDDLEMKNAESLSSALGLLVLLCRYNMGTISSPRDTISRTISYINEHIHEQITIDTLCDVSHTSKYHLCRKFKSQMGMTIVEYITDTRIELAKEMLTGKDKLSVSTVSERCGFVNESYFCAVFKKRTGVSPLGYMRELKK